MINFQFDQSLSSWRRSGNLFDFDEAVNKPSGIDAKKNSFEKIDNFATTTTTSSTTTTTTTATAALSKTQLSCKLVHQEMLSYGIKIVGNLSAPNLLTSHV
jgi:hypothetical protein